MFENIGIIRVKGFLASASVRNVNLTVGRRHIGINIERGNVRIICSGFNLVSQNILAKIFNDFTNLTLGS